MPKSFLGTVLRLKTEKVIDALRPDAPVVRRPDPVVRHRPQPARGTTPRAAPTSPPRPPEAPVPPRVREKGLEPVSSSPLAAMMVKDVLGRWSRAHCAGVEGGEVSAGGGFDHLAVVGGTLVVIAVRHWSGLVTGSADAGEWTIRSGAHAEVRVPNPVTSVAGAADRVRQVSGAVPVESLVVLTGEARMSVGVTGLVGIEGLSEVLSRMGRTDDAGMRMAALDAYLRVRASMSPATEVKEEDVPQPSAPAAG